MSIKIDRSTHLVLVLTSDDSEHFKQYPNFAGGLYSAPLIGIIVLDPTLTTVSMGNQDIKENWCTWIEKNPLEIEKGIIHVKTKSGTRSVGRVPKDDEDHVFMYRVSHRANLENHTIKGRFAKGSMGFIADALEIIPKPCFLIGNENN